MFQIFVKTEVKVLSFVFILIVSCMAGEQLDKTKYITVDEIRPGMEAYCLTCFKGTKIEKFNLEVLDVVMDFSPGKNAIMVQGTDERFIHSGPVAGCSGSPVYIEGRLAGALAFGWTFSKDPLYGVTPIEEMLRVGQEKEGANPAGTIGFTFDFSRPLDFTEIENKIKNTSIVNRTSLAAGALPCPLITSGLSTEVCRELEDMFEPFGFTVVAGPGGGDATSADKENIQLEPGSCLVVPFITGDIKMAVLGTVTEVVGDKVYGFGHSFLGFGPTDFPMATGKVYTVVSNVARSFKFGSAVEVVGALTKDESTAVYGQIGAKAKTIPIKINVSCYNDIEKRVYNCRMAKNRLMTPMILAAAVQGAAFMRGDLPLDHMIEYKVSICTEKAGTIEFENISTAKGLDELITESMGSVALLLNNPYREVDITSLDFDVKITNKNILSHIWSAELSDSTVKAGEKIDVSIVVESVRAGTKRYQYSLKVPDDLTPGKYNLVIMGSEDYLDFLRESVPYRFISEDLTSLIEVVNEILDIKKDKLYCVLILPEAGVAVERAELPSLPATKAIVLQDSKRTLKTKGYQRWLEKSIDTSTIVIDKKIMTITVEE